MDMAGMANYKLEVWQIVNWTSHHAKTLNDNPNEWPGNFPKSEFLSQVY